MGYTRILFTDATTAEAITALKTLGFLETPDGGCFLCQGSPIKIYSVWGKARYYPELLGKVDFPPRIQIHFKCKEDSELNRILQGCTQGLLRQSGGTRLKAFDVNTGEEIAPALLKG